MKTPWLLISLTISLLSATGILGYQNYQLKQQTPSPSPQLVVNSPLPETDPTAEWKKYTNPVLNYSISYPADWNIDISKAEIKPEISGIEYNDAELIIFQGDYKLKIQWPAAYGPGICLFDDQSREGAPEIAGFCEGEYVEFKNKNQGTHRRLVKPRSDVPEAEIFYDQAKWTIYTHTLDKGGEGFVTVPPISYTAPLEYRKDLIKIMDQILASYESKNNN